MIDNTLISNDTKFPEWFTSASENPQGGNQNGEWGTPQIILLTAICVMFIAFFTLICLITPKNPCSHFLDWCTSKLDAAEKGLMAKDPSHHVHFSIQNAEEGIVIAGGENAKLMD